MTPKARKKSAAKVGLLAAVLALAGCGSIDECATACAKAGGFMTAWSHAGQCYCGYKPVSCDGGPQ